MRAELKSICTVDVDASDYHDGAVTVTTRCSAFYLNHLTAGGLIATSFNNNAILICNTNNLKKENTWRI